MLTGRGFAGFLSFLAMILIGYMGYHSYRQSQFDLAMSRRFSDLGYVHYAYLYLRLAEQDLFLAALYGVVSLVCFLWLIDYLSEENGSSQANT